MVREYGHGVLVLGGVVVEYNARGVGYQTAYLVEVVVLAQLHIHRLAVSAHHGHTHHCGGNLYVGVAEYLACLVHQLLLLGGVAVLLEVTSVGEQVAVYLVGIGVLHMLFSTLFGLQLAHSLDAGACDALVGGYHKAAYAVAALQRREGQHHLYGGTVGVGNDAVAYFHGVDVHLRHYQWLVGVLAPGRAIVYHRGAHGGEQRRVLPRGGGPCREDGILRTRGYGVVYRDHRQLPAGEGYLLADTLGRGGGYYLFLGEATLFKHREHLASHKPRGSHYSNLHHKNS